MAALKNCEECTRPSNNQYFNCPPRMSDGRHFTDYRPRCAQQYQDKISNKLMSSYEHRMYLVQNADAIMKQNAAESYNTNKCGPCVEPYDQGTMMPEFEKQECNERTCSFGVSDSYGLGLGRQFYTQARDDSFKQKFLAEKQKETDFFKQSAQCCGTINDDIQYFPLDGMIEKEYPRPTVPGGGKPFSGGDRIA
jgi:hypothetical protein